MTGLFLALKDALSDRQDAYPTVHRNLSGKALLVLPALSTSVDILGRNCSIFFDAAISGAPSTR